MSISATVVSAVLLLLGAASAGEQGRSPSKSATRNVAIVVYEGVELLDFAGPAEVSRPRPTSAPSEASPHFASTL